MCTLCLFFPYTHGISARHTGSCGCSYKIACSGYVPWLESCSMALMMWAPLPPPSCNAAAATCLRATAHADRHEGRDIAAMTDRHLDSNGEQAARAVVVSGCRLGVPHSA